MENAFDKLTEIQKEVGYEKGTINNIALLGLFGESGEVLNECAFTSGIDVQDRLNFIINEFLLNKAVTEANNIDSLKKKIRDKKQSPLLISIKDEEKFDGEMADVLYYLNALAINRGKTLAYYAELSCNKVMKYKTQKDIRHANVKHAQ